MSVFEVYTPLAIPHLSSPLLFSVLQSCLVVFQSVVGVIASALLLHIMKDRVRASSTTPRHVGAASSRLEVAPND